MVETYKDKFNKKYGFEKDTPHSLEDISKITGYQLEHLKMIFDKGVGAYKTNPKSVRPNVKSPEQWAMARIYSAVMGGKASKVDASHLVKGAGIGSVVQTSKNLINNTISRVHSSIEGLIPSTTKYTPSTQGIIDKYGKFKVINMLVIKTPVNGTVMKLANGLTSNQLSTEMKKKGIDTFYHISLRVEQMDDLGNQIFMLVEKNDNILIRRFLNSDITMSSKTLPIAIGVNQFNLHEMMARTRLRMGNELYFTYNALSNNCGMFIIEILKANYVYNADDEIFLSQVDKNNKKINMSDLQISNHSKDRMNILTKLGSYIRGKKIFGGEIQFT